MNANVNGGLWVAMMCQCRSINYNQCTSFMRDDDSGENHTCRGKRNMRNLYNKVDSIIIIPILQMTKLWHREVKQSCARLQSY